MNTITVDGHDYRISEHENGNETGVYVYDANGDLIGAAFLDGNLEQGHVDFESGSQPINYFEWNDKPLKELARWVAGVYYQ